MFEPAVRRNNWMNITFFAITHGVTLIGLPLYLINGGKIGLGIWILTVFYFFFSGWGVTVGYHRLFAHRTYNAHPIVQFILLFFAAAAFEMPALEWANQHRTHHRYVDTEKDPYNIKQGFFYAHMGWMMFWKHSVTTSNTQDLEKNPMIMNQHKYYVPWAVTAGILIPILIGVMLHQVMAAILVAVCARLTVVYQGTFCINSVCHYFGKPTYDRNCSARDHWLVATVTQGEGYHSFHHRFPNDYRNGVMWYHWDPSKWVIAGLEKLGLARDLKRASCFQITAARMSEANRSVEDQLTPTVLGTIEKSLADLFFQKYQTSKALLYRWEEQWTNYKKLQEHRHKVSERVIHRASLRMKASRKRFEVAYLDWKLHFQQLQSLLQAA